ncbi:hypothetical protein C8J56DRAFT_1032710 [Mycena floridula]|nr:hypothetical protein C8J56DRAFT_1032710 [Mycena floridula]
MGKAYLDRSTLAPRSQNINHLLCSSEDLGHCKISSIDFWTQSFATNWISLSHYHVQIMLKWSGNVAVEQQHADPENRYRWDSCKPPKPTLNELSTREAQASFEILPSLCDHHPHFKSLDSASINVEGSNIAKPDPESLDSESSSAKYRAWTDKSWAQDSGTIETCLDVGPDQRYQACTRRLGGYEEKILEATNPVDQETRSVFIPFHTSNDIKMQDEINGRDHDGHRYR